MNQNRNPIEGDAEAFVTATGEVVLAHENPAADEAAEVSRPERTAPRTDPVRVVKLKKERFGA